MVANDPPAPETTSPHDPLSLLDTSLASPPTPMHGPGLAPTIDTAPTPAEAPSDATTVTAATAATAAATIDAAATAAIAPSSSSSLPDAPASFSSPEVSSSPQAKTIVLPTMDLTTTTAATTITTTSTTATSHSIDASSPLSSPTSTPKTEQQPLLETESTSTPSAPAVTTIEDELVTSTAASVTSDSVDTTLSSVSASTATAHSSTSSTTAPAAAQETAPVSTESNVSPSKTTLFGPRKVRTAPGSNISRRITMLASGKNENNSDQHTLTSPPSTPGFSNNGETEGNGSSGRESPDLNDYPDSFFEQLLREDQTTLSRSFTTMPKKPATRTASTVSTHSLPGRFNSARFSSSSQATAVAGEDEEEPLFVESGDLQEDLKKLQTELSKAKDTKTRAEADAKAQRVTVMQLKTEIQLVRNVLKRRETELGDAKDMSGLYEHDLAELRQKLEQAERQLSRGQGEWEAKVRALERVRDESVDRIRKLDADLAKLREQLAAQERQNEMTESELQGLRDELEELTPFREAAQQQREFSAQESGKVKELTAQITDLEDTRDIQAALIEELETKITTVEAEALAFKGKAEQEYDALSEGFKVLKSRRSQEILELKTELEQHKLQEQIIEKLQADVDHLQAALAQVATSRSTENARISRVAAELNEALALKDQEVVQVRKNMTEFEESHNRLVSSLQETLTTINEEAESARKSRDEALTALETLKEELQALRHSLPINDKHMSLSEWSAEQQRNQQEQQLKAIQELEVKVVGQVEGVKGDQQRAGLLEANTKRKSQQLTLDMEHHLHLSSTMVQNQSSTKNDLSSSEVAEQDDDSQKGQDEEEKGSTAGDAKGVGASGVKRKSIDLQQRDMGTVSVRTMLKFLAQLQGRQLGLSSKEPFSTTNAHVREGTDVTLMGDSTMAAGSGDLESELRVFLLGLNDIALLEPWAREKQLESEIDQLSQKIQTLLGDLSLAKEKQTEAQVALKEAQLAHKAEPQAQGGLEMAELDMREEELEIWETSIREKEQVLHLKEETLEHKERVLETREQELIAKIRLDENQLQLHKGDAFPLTPPFSAPITPYGSPLTNDLLPTLMSTTMSERHGSEISEDEDESLRGEGSSSGSNGRGRILGSENDKDDEVAAVAAVAVIANEKNRHVETSEHQLMRIKTLEAKIRELEKRSSMPLPPLPMTIIEESSSGSVFPSPPMGAGPFLSSRNSLTRGQNLHSMRSSLLSEVPPPNTALPPIPVSPDSSDSGSETKGGRKAATEAAVAAAVAKSQESQRELQSKLEQSETELEGSQQRTRELEAELALSKTRSQESEQALSGEATRLKTEHESMTAMLEQIRQQMEEAVKQARGLEALKTQLEAQVQQERRAKDDAVRAQDRLQSQLEEALQKKRGFLCF